MTRRKWPMLARLLLVGTSFLASATAAAAQVAVGDETVERMHATPAVSIDPALPERAFGAWLGDAVPGRSRRTYRLDTCEGAAAASGEGECIVLDIDIVSRHRQILLEFAPDGFAFRGGLMSATELEGVFQFDSLAALPDLARRAMRPFPLDCPPGTILQLRESYAGLFEWCEDESGSAQGPARAWFSTGIYLMHRGQYTDGAKSGTWLECTRFERCAENRYDTGVRQ